MKVSQYKYSYKIYFASQVTDYVYLYTYLYFTLTKVHTTYTSLHLVQTPVIMEKWCPNMNVKLLEAYFRQILEEHYKWDMVVNV